MTVVITPCREVVEAGKTIVVNSPGCVWVWVSDIVMVDKPPGNVSVEHGGGLAAGSEKVDTTEEARRITFVSRVTAAVRAYKPPSFVTPVVAVIEAYAMIFPPKAVVVPKVAELPTFQ